LAEAKTLTSALLSYFGKKVKPNGETETNGEFLAELRELTPQDKADFTVMLEGTGNYTITDKPIAA
jgi:hypothetical protein